MEIVRPSVGSNPEGSWGWGMHSRPSTGPHVRFLGSVKAY